MAGRGVIRGNTIQGTYGAASVIFSALEAVGIDLDDVSTTCSAVLFVDGVIVHFDSSAV